MRCGSKEIRFGTSRERRDDNVRAVAASRGGAAPQRRAVGRLQRLAVHAQPHLVQQVRYAVAATATGASTHDEQRKKNK